jgi:hypothetical protein
MADSVQPRIPPRYSFSWANSVVATLCESRPRATENVLLELRLTRRQLAYYLANEPAVWEGLKKIIRQVDVWQQHQERCVGDPNYYIPVGLLIDHFKGGKLPDRLFGYLTAVKNAQ